MIKIKFIQDTEKSKKGEVAEVSEKSAKVWVEDGFAIYVKKAKVKSSLQNNKKQQKPKKKIKTPSITKKKPKKDSKKKVTEVTEVTHVTDGMGGGKKNINKYNNKTSDNLGDSFTPPLPEPSPPSQPSHPSQLMEYVLFNFDLQSKYIHPAVGIHYGKYYFGFNLPMKYEKQVKIKKETEVMTFEGLRLHFITDDKVGIGLSELKGYGTEPSGDLFQNELRWELSHIESYTKGLVFSLDPIKMFEMIKKEYKTYIDFADKEEYNFFPLWDIGTYFYTLFYSYPYVHLHGLKNTGKSKVMALSSNITFNAELVSSMTLSTLFRLTQQNRSTLYIDEYEVLRKDKQSKEDKEFEILLNNGYRYGLTVPRMEQEGQKWVIKRFEVYCPKMIANISGLIGALPSRCIKIIMRRAMADDPRGATYPDSKDSSWLDIRNNLYIFALENWKKVKSIYNSLEKEIKISNREWELWKPILSIAKFIDEELYERMKKFAEKKVNDFYIEEEATDSWDYLLLKILDEIINEDRYYSLKKEIHYRLKEEFVERQYTDGGGSTQKIYKRIRPSPEWIGRTLRKMGLTKARKRRDGAYYFLSKPILSKLLQRLNVKSLQEPKEPKLGEEKV